MTIGKWSSLGIRAGASATMRQRLCWVIDEPKFATSIRQDILFPGSRQERKSVVESQRIMGTCNLLIAGADGVDH